MIGDKPWFFGSTSRNKLPQLEASYWFKGFKFSVDRQHLVPRTASDSTVAATSFRGARTKPTPSCSSNTFSQGNFSVLFDAVQRSMKSARAMRAEIPEFQ